MQTQVQFISIETISEWLIDKIAEELAVAPEIIDTNRPFAEYGLDSLAAVVVTGDLEEWLNIPIPATLLWDYPTINYIAQFLESEYIMYNQACLAIN